MNATNFEKGSEGVFRITGTLTIETVPALMRRACEALRDVQDGAEVEMDLGGVESCDSAAIALLLEWRREARRRNWTLKYSNLPEKLVNIARISDVDGLLSG